MMKTTSIKDKTTGTSVTNQHVAFISPGEVTGQVLSQIGPIKASSDPTRLIASTLAENPVFQQFIKSYQLEEMDSQDILVAFVHSSFTNEIGQNKIASYERLEFLGDSVLELIVTEKLISMCPDFSEGVLSKLRGQLVSRSELSRLADVLGLDHFILVGKGESSQKTYSQESIKADVFEALLGTIYTSLGAHKAKQFFYQVIENRDKLESVPFFQISRVEGKNYKGRLQEFLMKNKRSLPLYTDAELPTGEFMVTVTVDKKVISKSINKNKKQAQVNAAKEALEYLTQQ